ncbi:ferritin family protein [Pseudothermotoga thermarum]|uniref:Rubrerythrin n=1 Tax=Pseudothermotoga thermarum DSM 5069 TaxID=688269 RepID=F7YVA3_9THEM|nr:ferritin family protein [Pseudothermotoga thermarum]AEH50406.1 Rubrerythrin [Pseudothermotoga thermarum DSM 5069]
MFNIDEIFEIAEQIERNGVQFYSKAAEKFHDYSKKSILLKLADMEKEHEKRFHEMRLELAKRESQISQFLDPQNEARLYLHSIANSKVFDLRADPLEKLRKVQTVQDLLRIAIDLEKDSIIFYLGIKEFVPSELGKDKIDLIVKEEMGHVKILTDLMENL